VLVTAQTPPKAAAPITKPVTKRVVTPKRKAPSKAARAKKKSTAAKKSSKRVKAARVRRPAGQQRPTPERYKEIEAALYERGYLTASPTGQWSAASVEALRRFQADQELPSTGRLDSLSLIRLGLGPQGQ
jgi:outer membrane biosynthesis protein TonB